MKTLIVWFLVTYGSNGAPGFSPAFPSLQACEQFKQVAMNNVSNKGRCIQATIVDQGK